MNNKQFLYGLIGFPLGHSFSQKYFTEKFKKEHLQNHSYSLFEIDTIEKFPLILQQNPNLSGLNVTIPYKKKIIPFLQKLDHIATKIGAVNLIKITKDAQLFGYNSDYFGFKQSLENWIPQNILKNTKAIILGNGGAAAAAKTVLENMNIPFIIVERQQNLLYSHLTKDIIQERKLIINTTPLGMSPNTNTYPPIPYNFISPKHYLYDMVYNPEITLFMKQGIKNNASVKNGYEMLHLQAEKSWEIWNTITHT